MTVIVWDGKTLAADKLGLQNGFRIRVTKITKLTLMLPGEPATEILMGYSGRLSIATEFFRWISSGLDESRFPAEHTHPDNGGIGMVIHPTGGIMVYDHSSMYYTVDNKTHAIGGGAEMALVALELGCDAVKTVETVSKVVAYCGMGYDSLTFSDEGELA